MSRNNSKVCQPVTPKFDLRYLQEAILYINSKYSISLKFAKEYLTFNEILCKMDLEEKETNWIDKEYWRHVGVSCQRQKGEVRRRNRRGHHT